MPLLGNNMQCTKVIKGAENSACKVFYGGKDVTPKPLQDPIPTVSVDGVGLNLNYNSPCIDSERKDQSVKSYFTPCQENVIIVEDKDGYKDKAGMELPIKLAKMSKNEILKILLIESETIHLLHINSVLLEDGDEERMRDGDETDQNKKKTVKTSSCETQTLQIPTREQTTMTNPIIKKDSSTFVSNWDLYCSSLDKKAIPKKGKKTKFWSKFEKSSQPTLAEDAKKIFSQQKFKNACIITERLLASNNYSEKQNKFLGDGGTGSPKECSEFKYKMDKLWSFKLDNIFNHSVTSISWNPIIKDNVAVGYGTFDFHESSGGLVCLWSILNPCQPEQSYKFEHSINDIKFSKELPHKLAVACFDGSIWVIDLMSDSRVAINGYQLHHLGPVWTLEWVIYDDCITKEEMIISVGNDGRICKWDICNKFGCSLLFHLINGPEKMMKPCLGNVVKGDHCLSGLSLTIDPTNSSIYYVGTGQGFLVKCSTYLRNSFEDIFVAHQGPVYSVNFSPFCKNLLLTCGGDWSMRLWIKGVMKPLLTICTAMEAVMGAVWSPIHSTVIASISGNELAIWDLSRKMLYPLRVVSIRKNSIFTTIQFTKCGNNIVAGDDEGNVHIYNLQEMPYIPYHQERLIINSLKLYVKSNPKLLSEVEKLEKAAN